MLQKAVRGFQVDPGFFYQTINKVKADPESVDHTIKVSVPLSLNKNRSE